MPASIAIKPQQSISTTPRPYRCPAAGWTAGPRWARSDRTRSEPPLRYPRQRWAVRSEPSGCGTVHRSWQASARSDAALTAARPGQIGLNPHKQEQADLFIAAVVNSALNLISAATPARIPPLTINLMDRCPRTPEIRQSSRRYATEETGNRTQPRPTGFHRDVPP